MTKKVPMTVEGAKRLKAELHRLKTVDRPAVIAAIAEARSHGDLAENADYDAAKERQGFIEGRIAEVERRLAHAQVINPAEIDADGRIVFGATVELVDLKTGDAVTYQIVVSNAGPSAVANAPFSDTAPASLSGVSWTCSASVGSS